MRTVTSRATFRWRRPRVDDAAARHARIERLGLVAATLVTLFGLYLTAAEQRAGSHVTGADLAAGRVVNINALAQSDVLIPLLQTFREPAERAAVAEALYERARQAPQLEHVGGLARASLPASRVTADARLTTLNERLRRRGGDAVPVLSTSDLAALKPALIVRSAGEYRQRLLWAVALFLGAFWCAHAVRALLGLTGDPILLPAVHLLTGLGLMTMVALRDPLRDTMAVATMAEGIAIGCAIWVAISLVDFEAPRLRRAVVAPLAAAVALALGLLAFGSGPTGTDAKVNLLGAQPVELIRPLFVFSLAAYFARRWQHLRELSEAVGPRVAGWRARLPRWRDVSPLAISLGTLLVFSFLQKDLGPALVLACVFLGLFGLARGRAALVACGLLALVAGLWAGYAAGVPSTVTRRVAIWLDPWENALQGGDQVSHSLWALSTGALTGLGPGGGDPQLIPAGHTDLIVAALGEELGFIGFLSVAALLALVAWRMFRAAVRAPGDYTAFLAFGLTLGLVAQALVIVGGTLGLLPLTGVVTPFLSFGRSSMISNIAAVAIGAAIARRGGRIREAFVMPARVAGWTLAVAAVAVVWRAAAVQVVHADTLAAAANLTQQADGGYRYQYNPRLVAAGRSIPRGTIYDRNGVPLATSRAEEITSFADSYRALGLPLATGCQEPRGRCYPLGGLAFHVIGDVLEQTNWAARNTSFVERDLDAQLKGFDDHPRTVDVRHPRTGAVHPVVRRDYSELLPLVRHRGDPSHAAVAAILNRKRDVHLALDARLQVHVARAVRARAAQARSDAAAAVVLDPATGGVLASASYPWPEEPAAATMPVPAAPAQLLDRVRYGLYPPGSTFKLVTAVAALRSPADAQRSTFMCTRLPDGRVGGRVRGVSRAIRDDIADHEPHGNVDLHRALVHSCNPYFAQLAQAVGNVTLAETAAAAQIAAAPRPAVDHLPRTLPHAGYGQGDVLASPLRMAGVAAALASGGLLRQPVIATTPAEHHAAPQRWVSADGAARLRGYMREVVTGGTGRVLAGHAVRIAGKTGTAEVDDAPAHSWFVGYAPHGGRRQIAFATLVEHAGYGARSAAPLAGDIVERARQLGLVER